MDQGRTCKIFESKREGSRRRGRPRVRWLEDVGKNVREMKAKRWRQKAVDREEWASIIKEAKAVEGRRAEEYVGKEMSAGRNTPSRLLRCCPQMLNL